MIRHVTALVWGVVCASPGWGATPVRADDQDASALALADMAPAATERGGDWRSLVEGSYGNAGEGAGGSARYAHRLSLDVRYDRVLSAGWRAILADRLDVNRPAQATGQSSINTLKEAYLSWRAQANSMDSMDSMDSMSSMSSMNSILDFGRINVRYGVATGYSPTDYFRAGALRSVVSINPASLKENRQGSVMWRGQWLWDRGSLTALHSPRLSDRASRNAFSPDWGATNNRQRWLIALSQKIGDNIAPQFLIYREEERPAQLGLNLTGVVDAATVAYLEWSGGRSPSLLTQALRQTAIARPDDSAFRNRLSTGLTYTASNRISMTAELEYNGGGLERTGWDGLRRGSPLAYAQYRNWLQVFQEPPTRRLVFLNCTWQDALINRLDLSAMLSSDLVDSSRRSWLEARYRDGGAEYVLQWQRGSGQSLSNYGATSQTNGWQALLRYYF